MPRARRPLRLFAAALVLVAASAAAQSRPRGPLPTPRPPAPDGRQIETADGDTVIVDGDDRVVVLRRHRAEVRVIADAERQSVLVLADWGTFDRPSPDGGVDGAWKFEGVQGAWPLDARWQGAIDLFEPELVRAPHLRPTDALVLETPAGRVSFRGGPARTETGDGVVLAFRRMNAGGRQGLTFDQAERDAASPNASWSMSSFDFGGPALAGASTRQGPQGLPATLPRPVHRVEPAWPDPATMPGVNGIVTVRVTVDGTGVVREAVVVRSLPGLDDAALAAARQWRFEPTGVDGRPFAISWPFPLRPR